MTAHGIIDETGREREIDVLVMCTGFHPAQFLATYEVVGRAGRTIHEYWGDTPRAYLGLMVPEFPNFYMMYGPNTNGAPIMFLHQRQAEFVSANIKRMIKADVTAIEVKPWVLDLFNWIVQKPALCWRRRPAPGGPQLRTVRLGTQRHPVERGMLAYSDCAPALPPDCRRRLVDYRQERLRLGLRRDADVGGTGSRRVSRSSRRMAMPSMSGR